MNLNTPLQFQAALWRAAGFEGEALRALIGRVEGLP
jgi:hypothetical protein